MAGFALKRLMAEYKRPSNYDNFFEWSCLITGPPGTCFENGVFPAKLTFPEDYPLSPPKMRFTCEFFHPNIYPDGKVCISILHTPGNDPTGYESSSERWSPVLSVEKILISVVSMLAEPNDASPANVDAAKMWRDNRAEFEKIGRDIAQRTLVHANNIPQPVVKKSAGDAILTSTTSPARPAVPAPVPGLPKRPDDNPKQESSLLFVVGSLVAVLVGVFVFFKFFKSLQATEA